MSRQHSLGHKASQELCCCWSCACNHETALLALLQVSPKNLSLEEVNNELTLRQDVRQAQLKLSLTCANLLVLIHKVNMGHYYMCDSTAK